MATHELFSGERYLYNLGMDEDPSEAIEAEQRYGTRRLRVIRVAKGKRVEVLRADEPEQGSEYDSWEYEEDEENA